MNKIVGSVIGWLFVLLVCQCKWSDTNTPVPKPASVSWPVDRLTAAYAEKSSILKRLLAKQNLSFDDYEVLIRAFKEEELLEVWTRKKGTQPYSFLISYPFCNSSGVLGPKRKQGDYQIPEGIYRIDRFNPNSNYYLSLGINYPNGSDLILGNKTDPGANIFIHGDCVTIGCIPLTDDKIKEVYVLAEQAKRNGQQTIYVHLFPAKLTDSKYKKLIRTYPKHKSLWQPLQKVYLKFEETSVIPYVHINPAGIYEVRD